MRAILLLLSLITVTIAQNLSDWETITTVNEVTGLASNESKIWIASTGGIYSYDKSTAAIEKYNNLDGMFSINTRCITADDHDNVLMGNVKGVLEIFNYKDNEWAQLFPLEGNEIVDLFYRNDTLWAAAGKGLAVFIWNGKSYAFNDYFKNFPVLINKIYTLSTFGGRILLGTDRGLLSAPADLNRYAINDPALWKRHKNVSDLGHEIINDLKVMKSQLWIATRNGIITADKNFNFRKEARWGDIAAHHFALVNDTVFVAVNKSYFPYIPDKGRIYQKAFDFKINALYSDQNNHLLCGLDGGGIFSSQWPEPMLLDGPNKNIFRYVIKDSEGNIWASASRVKGQSVYGFYKFNGEVWKNYSFSGSNWNNLRSMATIYEDRFQNIWLGSWGGGLMSITAQNDTLYFHNFDAEGSLIVKSFEEQETIPLDDATVYSGFFSGVQNEPSYEVIPALKEDDFGRLWIVIYWAANNKILAAVPYEADGFISLDAADWFYFTTSDNLRIQEEGITCMEFDDFGRVWLGTISDGIFILDYNNTLTNKSDDQVYTLKIGDNLYSNSILSLASDRDGVMWIGTAAGLNSFDGVNLYRHVGDENGLSGPLENRINQIVVDDYNNKWFATPGGLSILRGARSPWDPEGWIGFTTGNSGLVDNEVNSIFVDARQSEALIATEQGLSVYRGSFAEIQDDYTQVSGGPNPFNPNEDNRFVITNLMQNSTVKIYSLNGVLIRELNTDNNRVDGSRAHWDGYDSLGNLVASGIYLYLAYSDDGKSTAGKIAVIRK